MTNQIPLTPAPVNEPTLSYAPDSPERKSLQAALKRQQGEQLEIPLMIGGQEVRTGDTDVARCPHRHAQVLAKFHQGDAQSVARAAEAAKKAWPEWSRMPWEERAAIFLKAAELLAGPYRAELNAATMNGQSKNAYQAEIDSACELIDFWRFNVEYARQIYSEQPLSSRGVWNRVEQRPLEGFVFAVTPFNFTAIGGNLPTAPALMGNTVVWKPASTAIFSGWKIMQLLHEAGLPPGVINFVPGAGSKIGNPAIAHPELAGVHFTGSTGVFNGMWKSIGANIDKYKSYPRIVGETGGKDFVFAHPSADPEALVVALVRGSFEYQGQKCSAASRAYIPRSLWPRVGEAMVEMTRGLKMGPVDDFTNFVNAVIDQKAFESIKSYIDGARSSSSAKILVGGECDASQGYFIRPTIIQVQDPTYRTMCEEIFGPVLTVYVYDDAKLDETMALCDSSSPYALTGAIFARDRRDVIHMADRLRHAAGNFYVNDKPTGAVVGQQPFGGSRASGTNDKAGSKLNLLRWVSTRTIKENFVPPRDYRYPFLAPDA
ncbi:MAG: L-glutamate gamma-semialdehyde dehydrogenase [Planctomycetes bacterium]|nr:L-glutamate gamma-semialdehyde dehydrogenase [Planctomycetota bacterium]